MKRLFSGTLVYLVFSSIACFVYFHYWQPIEIKTSKHTVRVQSEALQNLQRKNVELRQQLANRAVEDQLAVQSARVQQEDEAKWCSLTPGQLEEEAKRLEWINGEIGRFKERVSKLNGELNGKSK